MYIIQILTCIFLINYANGESVFQRKRTFLHPKHKIIQNVGRGGDHGDGVLEDDRFTDYSSSSDESSSSENMKLNQEESHNESDDEYENDNEEKKDVVSSTVSKDDSLNHFNVVEIATEVEESDAYDENVNMTENEDGISEERGEEDHEIDLLPLVDKIDIDFSDTTISEDTVPEKEEELKHDEMNTEGSIETDDMDLRMDAPSSSIDGQDSPPDEISDIDYSDALSSAIQENDESILNHNQLQNDDDDDQSIAVYDDMKAENYVEGNVDLGKDTINPNYKQDHEYDSEQPSNIQQNHQDQNEIDDEEDKEQDYPLNDVVIDQQMHEDISADMADVETDFTTVAMTDDVEDEDVEDEDVETKKMSNGLIETDLHSKEDSTETGAYGGECIVDKDETTKESNTNQESENASNDQENVKSPQVEHKDNQLSSEDTRRWLKRLSYSDAEIAIIKPSAAQIIANKMFKRPRTGVPPEFCMEGEQLPLTSTNTCRNQWSMFSTLKFDKDSLKKLFAPVIATSLFLIALTTSFSVQNKNKESLSRQDRVSIKDNRVVIPAEKIKRDESKISDQNETRNDDYLRRRYI